MKKKYTIPVIVLAAICLCAALLLAVTNSVTKSEIERQLIEKANAARREVLPNANNFEDITDKYEFDESVQAAHKADIGYVFQIIYKGFNSGNILMCGIDNEGNLVKSKIITYTDTYTKYLDKLNMDHAGADLNTAKSNVELATTATSETGIGYNKALTIAVNSYNIANGGEAVEPEEEEPAPKPEVFDNGGFMNKTDEEVFALAKEAFGVTSIEILTLPEDDYNKLPSVLKRAYKTDKGYVIYTATTTEYIKSHNLNETEALVATDKFGTVTDVKLLTWRVSGDEDKLDDPSFVEQINDTSALVASLNGFKYGIDNDVDIVTSATRSSNNLTNSILDGLKALKNHINNTLTEDDIKELALTLVKGADSLEKLEIADMPETLKAVYRTNDKSSYIFHIQTSTQYVAKETEVLLFTTRFGTIKSLEVINWNVGHGVYATEEYLNGYIGANRYMLEDNVELISSATRTAENLRNAVSDALECVFPTPIYTYVAIAIMAVALIAGVSLAIVFKRRRRV